MMLLFLIVNYSLLCVEGVLLCDDFSGLIVEKVSPDRPEPGACLGLGFSGVCLCDSYHINRPPAKSIFLCCSPSSPPGYCDGEVQRP